MSPAGIEPIPGTSRQVNQCFRSFGLDGLTMNCGLMSYGIIGHKLIKPLRDNTCQIDYGNMCIRTDFETKSTFPNVEFS